MVKSKEQEYSTLGKIKRRKKAKMGICRIDDELEQELKKIQENIRKQIGNVNLPATQASRIAAKIIREKNPIINVQFPKKKRGRQPRGMNFL